MSDGIQTGIQTWLALPDARLVDAAAAPGGAWLWSDDAERLIWANPAGSAVVAVGPVAPADPQRRQLAQLVPQLTARTRLQRLRGFGAAPGGLMTCACTLLSLADGGRGVLVVAMERGTPTLPLRERLARLLAPLATPLATFTADGRLAAANRPAQAVLDGLDDLSALDAGAAALATVLRDGEAAVAGRAGRLDLRRFGHGRDAVVLARPSADFAAPVTSERALPPTPEPPRSASELQPPAAAPVLSVRQRPLRFLWQMDADGRFSLGGDPFTRLIGVATAAACGRPWREINAALHLDPDDRVLRAMATRRTFSGITVRWPVDGSDLRLPVELSALPVCDAARRFLGYRGFGVCRDLDALAALAQQRRTALPAVPPAAVPAPPAPPRDLPMPIDPPPNVLPFRTASGEEVASLTPVENSAFNELARQLSARLERPLVAREAAPQVAEPDTGPAMLGMALEAVPDAALTLAAGGRIVNANRAAQALFAADAAGLADRTIFDLLAPADHHAVRAALAAAGPSASYEVHRRAAGANAPPLAMTLAPLEGGVACVVLRDRAAQHAQAHEIEALRRDLVCAEADKADLAAWVSRELRGPAEAIAAFADLMIDERLSPVGGGQDLSRLRDIRAAAQRISTTLAELRDLSRIESGAFELTPAPVSLNDVVESAIAEQQAAAGRARVVIRSSFAAALPEIVADPAALRQIAGNLIAIAIHLANAGGQAIVSTARTDDGRVMLRLRDTGPGLTEAELAAAAEPLRAPADADHATLTNAGVNLALTRALITASGATLAIRSAAASGTLIEVAFATAAEPSAA